MLLSMLVPILLALGAPITLALRAIRPRPAGSIDRGPREWLLVLLHSRAARVITHPLVVLALYLGTLYAFYFSPLFSASLQSHTAHMLMHAHFLLIGCLFYWPIVGIDPMPRRLPYLGRIGLVFASLPFHAFFAVVVMGDDSILGGDWFRRLSISWVDLHADQQTGGGFAWAFSEIPTLILIVAIVVQWYRADRREARRFDRHEDRTGDAQLTAYNDWLSSLSGRESSSREPSDR